VFTYHFGALLDWLDLRKRWLQVPACDTRIHSPFCLGETCVPMLLAPMRVTRSALRVEPSAVRALSSCSRGFGADELSGVRRGQQYPSCQQFLGKGWCCVGKCVAQPPFPLFTRHSPIPHRPLNSRHARLLPTAPADRSPQPATQPTTATSTSPPFVKSRTRSPARSSPKAPPRHAVRA
jgi:hypothetical protein